MKEVLLIGGVALVGLLVIRAMQPAPAQPSDVGAVSGAISHLADAAKAIWGSSSTTSTATSSSSSSSGSWFTDALGENWWVSK